MRLVIVYLQVYTAMSLSKIDRPVEEIVGRLTKAEVLACVPMGLIRWKDSRTWTTLKNAIQGFPMDIKTKIYEVALTKDHLLEEKMIAARKRKRSNYEWSRRMHRKINDSGYSGK